MSNSDQIEPHNWEQLSLGDMPNDLVEEIEDPRVDRRKLHLIKDILAIALCATIANADGWIEMEEFGKSKQAWLESWLELPNGIPSEDTFRRVISAIDSEQFGRALANLREWIREALTRASNMEDSADNRSMEKNNEGKEDREQAGDGQQVAIDGKCLRSANDEDHKRGNFYMLNAWATEEGVALGQRKVNGKSNEITEIPEILKLLSIKGRIFTIDAAGAQKNIAEIIIDGEGDYILGLKGNQETLHNEACNYFSQALELYDQSQEKGLEIITELDSIGISVHTSESQGHGRHEKREVFVLTELDWLPVRKKWKGLQSIVAVRSTRTCKGATSVEVRYYISSLSVDAKPMGKYIRRHWSIENSLHWILDVAFSEDKIGISKGNAPANLSMLRTLCLSLIQKNNRKGGVKTKRKKAAWDLEFLCEVLMGQ